jgi:3-oxoacyl-[acyl-carrier-protein] synthase-3
MDGPEIFSFTLKEVPGLVGAVLGKAGKTLEEIDHFVFHQANQYMLESLRRKIKIPKEKFIIDFQDCGNTVSSTIPIVLEAMIKNKAVAPGQTSLLVGFGVGYSWGAVLVRW